MIPPNSSHHLRCDFGLWPVKSLWFTQNYCSIRWIKAIPPLFDDWEHPSPHVCRYYGILWVSRFSALPCWYQNGLPATKKQRSKPCVVPLYVGWERDSPFMDCDEWKFPRKSVLLMSGPNSSTRLLSIRNFGHEKTPSASFVALLLPQRTQVVWINFLDSCDYRKRPDV